MKDKVDADVLVIGAGIAGAGAAAHIASDYRVVHVEMEDRPGYHTTGRSAAIFIQNYGGPTIRALSRASAAMFETADKALFPTPLLSPRGMLNVCGEDGIEHHDHLLSLSEGLRQISAGRGGGHVPILRRETIAAASYEEDARDIDVAALHQGCLKAGTAGRRDAGAAKPGHARRAQRRKVGRRNGDPRRSSRRSWSMRLAPGPTRSRSPSAWRRSACSRMRRSMAVLPAPEGYDTRLWPLFGDAAETWYAKPDGGRLFVSPAEEIPVDPHDAFVDDMILAEGSRPLRAGGDRAGDACRAQLGGPAHLRARPHAGRRLRPHGGRVSSGWRGRAATEFRRRPPCHGWPDS